MRGCLSAATLRDEQLDYDVVVIDTPTAIEEHPQAMKHLISLATYILIPTKKSNDDLVSVTPYMQLIRRSTRSAAYVLNMTKRNTLSINRAKKHLNATGRLCPIDVPDLEDIPRAFEFGRTVLEVRGSKGTDEARGVWQYVKQEIGL
jgi:chromosome partitioning protein